MWTYLRLHICELIRFVIAVKFAFSHINLAYCTKQRSYTGELHYIIVDGATLKNVPNHVPCNDNDQYQNVCEKDSSKIVEVSLFL